MLGLTPSSATIVLIVRDDSRRLLLAQQLEALGYSVVALTEAQATAALPQHRTDLVVVDLGDQHLAQNTALAALTADMLERGVPLLTLSASDAPPHVAWTQEALKHRVAAALRHQPLADIRSERLQRYAGLSILDEGTMLFNRRYFDALLPTEIERAKRTYQPLTLLLFGLELAADVSNQWQTIGVSMLTSLRQTDLVARFDKQTVVCLLPATEALMARAVAVRTIKTLGTRLTEQSVPVRVGLAAYPQHGADAIALGNAVQHALRYALEPGMVVSYDRVS